LAEYRERALPGELGLENCIWLQQDYDIYNLFGEIFARKPRREKFTANKEQKKIPRARQKAKKRFLPFHPGSGMVQWRS
jgi:hypothetical protein